MKSNLVKCFLVAFAIFAATACAPTMRAPDVDGDLAAKEAELQMQEAMRERLRLDARLQKVGHRVLLANVNLCGEKVANRFGLNAAVLETFEGPYRPAAQKIFGIGDRVMITAVTEGGPAYEAGIRRGDVVMGLNGEALPLGKRGLEAFIQKLDGQANFSVDRAGERMEIPVEPVAICDYPVVLNDQESINAYADGKGIVVTSGMVRFANTDDELALVIGHELAHNTMGHLGKKRTNAVIGTLFGAVLTGLTGVNVVDIGTQAGGAAFSQAFEGEADYVGTYYAARAGCDVSNAAGFWRRMAVRHPDAINVKGGSHPSTAERFVAIDATCGEIADKVAMQAELVPEKKE